MKSGRLFAPRASAPPGWRMNAGLVGKRVRFAQVALVGVSGGFHLLGSYRAKDGVRRADHHIE